MLIKAKLYEIWYLYYAHAEQENREAVEHSYDKVAVAKAVIAYIQEHYNSSISLVELSGAFHVSEGHLCRLFKTVTKMSVIEYINFYRISISAKLLGETRREIGEVAGMVGFNNISYFNKVFRKYMQITPRNFGIMQIADNGAEICYSLQVHRKGKDYFCLCFLLADIYYQ